MKATEKIAITRTPDGGEMVLFQHDRDFSIMVNGEELMLSRQHESELELARLGCRHLVGQKESRVLIGGLGMGYTLRQVLDMLSPGATVVVGELLAAVVEWNRNFFGGLNDHPLEDTRVVLEGVDIVELISQSQNSFNAILLDVDNGPNAMTDSGNSRLYSYAGMWACRRALRKKGCLSVWSAEPSKTFEQLLMSCGFHVRRFRVPAYKGSKAQYRFVWVAAEDRRSLPPGGGEPRRPKKSVPRENRRRPRQR